MFAELKNILKEKSVITILILLITLISLYAINEHVTTDYNRSRDTRMRISVLATIGGPCIPIIAQCCTSRNLSEGIYARRNDVPGGYCFHSDCDVVFTGTIYGEHSYTILIHPGKATHRQGESSINGPE